MRGSRIRVGVIGAGGFIGRCHVESIRRIGFVEVEALAESSDATARQAADDLSVPRAYSDYRALIEDPSLDVIDIATLNSLHHPAAMAALAAGKHVYCEKPLGLNAVQTAELLDRARAAGRAHGVAFNHRFYPMVQEAAGRVAAGEVGDVFYVSGGYLQDGMLLPQDFNWRLEPEQGGQQRVLGDLGAHWFDTIEHVTGKRIASVLCEIRTVVHERQRPLGRVPTFGSTEGLVTEPIHSSSADLATVLLRFAGGATTGVTTVSQVHAGRKCSMRVEVWGSAGSLGFDSEHSTELWLGARVQPNRLLVKDPSLMTGLGRRAAAYPSGHEEGFPDSHTAVLRLFYEAIRDGEWDGDVAYPTFAAGHRVQQIIDACYRSSLEGVWVDVDGTLGDGERQ